jgi:hypothetical protein
MKISDVFLFELCLYCLTWWSKVPYIFLQMT